MSTSQATGRGTSFQKQITDESASPQKRYQDLFVGREGLMPLLRYELLTMLLSGLHGALGLWARKRFYRGLFLRMGRGVVLGRDVLLRHPHRIELGDNILVDDGCTLDGRGKEGGGAALIVGSGTIVSRNTILGGKDGFMQIGQHCNFGVDCLVYSSRGKIVIEDYGLFGARCYIGGGRYHHQRLDIPIMEQGQYFRGELVIERNCWFGAYAVVLDGVRIGHDSIIGAGAVVTKDIPPCSIAAGVPARVIRKRMDSRE
ncbi:MAG: acyltransferase [Acidobacteriota bacterium]